MDVGGGVGRGKNNQALSTTSLFLFSQVEEMAGDQELFSPESLCDFLHFLLILSSLSPS